MLGSATLTPGSDIRAPVRRASRRRS
jgi:hypothetical protein